MIKILVFSPNTVEFGRGGEISSMELASGMFFPIMLKSSYKNSTHQIKLFILYMVLD
jgi:hypothetical protein